MRLLTAGESHGVAITGILDGFPAGLAIDGARLQATLARRQGGAGAGGRMKLEADAVSWTGGVIGGVTTGAPVAFQIPNRDDWTGRTIEPMTVPRPGHADLAAALKHGAPDLRWGLERASARETVARVVAGELCAQLLSNVGVRLGSYVARVGTEEFRGGDVPPEAGLLRRHELALADPVRCPDSEVSARMVAAIDEARRAGHTLGGSFVVFAVGVPAGLGSHAQWDRRLDGRLMAALGSVPGVKAVAIGDAVAQSRLVGADAHDALEASEDGTIRRRSNRAGGLEGGITNGEPVVATSWFKPLSSTLAGSAAGSAPHTSLDLRSGEPASPRYERSDTCAVPRATVVGEAMLAFVLLDALLEVVGADVVGDVVARTAQLRQPRVGSLTLRGKPWVFGAGG